MSQIRADFAASAPAPSRARPGHTFLPQKPSSQGPHGGRRGVQPHRVPPLSSSAATATSPAARRSMITQHQRKALRLSAFGFSNAPSVPATVRSEDGNASKDSAAYARAMRTKCADDASVVVTAPEKDTARFQLCVQALAEGCIQSYVRLFYLSHRDPICVDVLSQRRFVVPEDRLRWVQEQLSSVEVLRRQSEFTEVVARCRALADYFEGEGDLQEARWHLEMALQYSREALDHVLEFTTTRSLAEFLERHGELAAAAEAYESMRTLAMAASDEAKTQEACLDLVRVYRALGDALTAEAAAAGVDDPAEARRCYERSVQLAQRSHASAHEGEGLDALGKMHERSGQLVKALQYQRTFRDVSRQNQLRSQECRAVLNVAGLEERMGRSTEATASLHEALELAKDLGDAEKVCRATMQLGEVSRAGGDAEAAMTCFKAAFPAALESGNQTLVDRVRVAMGFAAGEYYFTSAGGGKGYLPIVCDDVRAQLAWMSNGEL